jgi:hypothetical protein
MGDILIGSLMIGDCSDRLCVPASRIWEFYDPQDETKLLHTDLVLLDEEVYFILINQTILRLMFTCFHYTTSSLLLRVLIVPALPYFHILCYTLV